MTDLHKEYRYERKFFISELTRHEVESIIKLHPAMFSEIFHQRFVNNIYFDSVNLANYFSTVYGDKQRNKVRIRWYGELFGVIEKPILEFKIKNGLLGRKQSYSLNPFVLDSRFDYETLKDVIDQSDIPEIVKVTFSSLHPSLLNRYSRRYFQSKDKNFRITVDNEQSFYQINCQNNSFLNRVNDSVSIILELKYNYEMDEKAERITNYFPFRMSKNAKYVNGIENLCVW